MKTLYSFKVGKPTFVDAHSQAEDGSEIISRTKSYEDVEIVLKKPSHREIDEMDLFYSIQISELQSKGIATRMMILNSYEDSGGLDSKKDVSAMKKLLVEIQIKRNEFVKTHAEGVVNTGLLEEIKDMTVKLEEYQQNLESVFDRSAESIAEKRVHLWATFNFTFIKEGDKYFPLFEGNSFEQKLDHYYEILDGDLEFEQKAFSKANILIASWIKRKISSEEDFKLLEEYIDEEFANFEK